MVVFSVLYPAAAGKKFDKDYYDATHIPLVKDAFGPTGLTDVKVLHGLPGPDGSAAPFVAMAHLTFESPQAMMASLAGPRGGEVMADVPKFTDITPTSQVSSVG